MVAAKGNGRAEAPVHRVSRRRVTAVRGASASERDDILVGEEPLEIRVAGPGQEPLAIAVTMRTPGSEEELAVGFLRTEGIIGDTDVAAIELGHPAILARPDDTVLVRLRRPFDRSATAKRHFAVTASCGICGKATIDEIAVRCDPVAEGPIVAHDVLLGLPRALRRHQPVFAATGGLHAAGLFTPDGRLVAAREDIGRHNALDKLVGWAVLNRRLPLSKHLLLVSGRASLEIVQKAAVAGIPIVCAVSAPSDLAVEAAERFGQTLVGFLEGKRFNIYSGPERIGLAELRIRSRPRTAGAGRTRSQTAP